MHVDRKRFLLLTAAIAAGCGGSQQREPAVIAATPPPDYDTTQGGGAPPPQPVENSQIASEELAAPVTVPEPPPPPPTVEYDPSAEGGYASPFQPGAMAGGGPVDPRISQICGALKRPGPACESFDETVSSCYRYGRVMEPKAAEAAAKCLASKSNSKRICEFGVDAKCAAEGAKKAPRAPGAAQSCKNILNVCSGAGYRGKDLTAANCQAALSGYKASVQTALVSCITEFCEISSCFYQVGY